MLKKIRNFINNYYIYKEKLHFYLKIYMLKKE